MNVQLKLFRIHFVTHGKFSDCVRTVSKVLFTLTDANMNAIPFFKVYFLFVDVELLLVQITWIGTCDCRSRLPCPYVKCP